MCRYGVLDVIDAAMERGVSPHAMRTDEAYEVRIVGADHRSAGLRFENERLVVYLHNRTPNETSVTQTVVPTAAREFARFMDEVVAFLAGRQATNEGVP